MITLSVEFKNKQNVKFSIKGITDESSVIVEKKKNFNQSGSGKIIFYIFIKLLKFRLNFELCHQIILTEQVAIIVRLAR